VLFSFCLTLISLSISAAGTDPGVMWQGFRGDGSSHAGGDLPLTWSENEGIAWITTFEGLGQSSPVIWDGRVLVTSVDGERDESLIITCLSLEDGEKVWQRDLEPTHRVAYTEMVARAAPTPFVDAHGAVVFFGSGDLFGLDHDGSVVWHRALTKEHGVFEGNHGIGSSPLVAGDTVYLLIDHEGPSYMLAVDRHTGETRWRQPRPGRVSWSTPLVVEDDGRGVLVVSTNGIVEGLDAGTGARIWFTEAIAKNTIASPTRYEGSVLVGSSEAASSMAIGLGGKGDITESHVAWRGASASSFGSPLVSRDHAYYVNRSGVVSCVSAARGEIAWKHRLAASCWASPMAAGDRIYFFTKDGETTVLAADPSEARVLAENRLPVGKEDAVYGVAASEQKLVVRTGSALTCIIGTVE